MGKYERSVCNRKKSTSFVGNKNTLFYSVIFLRLPGWVIFKLGNSVFIL